MTWCPKAASHYLSKCRPRSISTYGVTRPQWVNELFKMFTTLFSYSFHTTVPSASTPFHSTTIFTLAYLLPLSLAHLPQQKHHLNLLSSITKAWLTHTLASFWRKQSCLLLVWESCIRNMAVWNYMNCMHAKSGTAYVSCSTHNMQAYPTWPTESTLQHASCTVLTLLGIYGWKHNTINSWPFSPENVSQMTLGSLKFWKSVDFQLSVKFAEYMKYKIQGIVQCYKL